jgi:hypothetical protein
MNLILRLAEAAAVGASRIGRPERVSSASCAWNVPDVSGAMLNSRKIWCGLEPIGVVRVEAEGAGVPLHLAARTSATVHSFEEPNGLGGPRLVQ